MSVSATPSSNLRFTPTSVYIGQDVAFSFSFENTGGTGLDIWDANVTFDWQSPGYSYSLIGSIHLTVPSGAISSKIWLNIRIPQTTTGKHSFEVTTSGQASGDLSIYSASYPGTLIVVSVPILQLDCNADLTSGAAPLQVNFTSIVSGGLYPYNYSWSFGDGSTSTVANPSHTYTSAGTYNVTLIVTDTETNSQVRSESMTVKVTPPVSDPDPQNGGNLGLILIAGLCVIPIAAAIVLYIAS